eukprot:278943_1
MTFVHESKRIKELVCGYIRQNILIFSNINGIETIIICHLNGVEGVPYAQMEDIISNEDRIAQEHIPQHPQPAILINSVNPTYYFINNNPTKREFCNEMKNQYTSATMGAIVNVYKHLKINRNYREGITNNITGLYQWKTSKQSLKQWKISISAQPNLFHVQYFNCTLKILFLNDMHYNEFDDEVTSLNMNMHNKIWRK